MTGKRLANNLSPLEGDENTVKINNQRVVFVTANNLSPLEGDENLNYSHCCLFPSNANNLSPLEGDENCTNPGNMLELGIKS